MSSSPFVRPQRRNPLAAALEAVLRGIGEAQLSKQDPFWRAKASQRELELAKQAQELKSPEEQQAEEATKIAAAGSAKLQLHDRLASLVAAAMGGFADSVPPQEQITVGGPGGADNPEYPGDQRDAASAPDTPPPGGPRSYAMNMPSAAAVPPDFLPPDLAAAGGATSPGIRDIVLRAARGKASESKRNLEYVRAQTRASEGAANRSSREGIAAGHERAVDQRTHTMIEARRAELQAKEGGVMQRHRERLAQSDQHFNRAQQRQGLNAIDRLDSAAIRDFDRGLIDEQTLADRLTENSQRLGDVAPAEEDQGAPAPAPAAPRSGPPAPRAPAAPSEPEVGTRQEFDALADGKVFRKGGRRYKKLPGGKIQALP